VQLCALDHIAMSVDNGARARRSASVSISGSSNLPPEKLLNLSSSINKILQSIVDIYNSCDDGQMQVQEKFRKIAETRYLDKDIDQLIAGLGEEMNVCSEAIKHEMKPKLVEITQNAKELKFLIVQYSDDSSFRFQTAKAIFEGMLQLINDAIDLLKMADQHFVERLVNEANVALIYLKKVREASDINELVTSAQDYTTAFVNLVKRLQRRIESGVLYPDQKAHAEQALSVLRFDSLKVIDVKKNQLQSGNDMHSIALGTHVKAVVDAIKTVFEVARSNPKFAVDFQVDYVDDRFGILLSDLTDAIDKRDQPRALRLLDQVTSDVTNRISDTGLPHDEPRIQKLRQALNHARDTTYQCLPIKQENHENSAASIEAGKRIDASYKQLRESYSAVIPNQVPSETTNLRKAARSIVANLDKLVKVQAGAK